MRSRITTEKRRQMSGGISARVAWLGRRLGFFAATSSSSVEQGSRAYSSAFSALRSLQQIRGTTADSRLKYRQL
eukprot:1639750-Pleurochrysis_carterae.AAC.1